jgi:uncharacterized OsmC-like protein
VGFLQLHGALNERDADDGAVGNRDTRFAVGVKGRWQADGADTHGFLKWVRDGGERLRPFSTGRTYINFQTADEGEDRVRATYGDNLDRLVQVKQRYDPNNLFRFVFDADHPAVLVGRDNGPTPVEFVLHALAACLTAGLANIAAARKVKLTQVRSTVSGDIDLNGILGLNPAVRNGYQQITVRFTIKGDAPADKLHELLDQSRARSAVYDVITNQVPVTIEIDTPDTHKRRHDAPQARMPVLSPGSWPAERPSEMTAQARQQLDSTDLEFLVPWRDSNLQPLFRR